MTKKPGRGWGAVAAMALAAAMLSVVSSVLLIFMPLSLLLLALPPRRPVSVAVGLVLAMAAFWSAQGEALGLVERGWALLLGGWFVALAVLRPEMTFLSRALMAVAGAVVTSAGVLLASGGWGYVDWAVSRHFHSAAAMLASLWGAAGGAEPVAAALVDGVYQAAELQTMLHPALLSLASVAALGVAWWAHRRLSGSEVRPFSPFPEFRFRDELVWLLIAGIALVVFPAGESALRAGANLIAFMGALYVLRGTAVLLAVTGVPGVGAALFGLLALMILPMVTLATAMVGLADTWIDLRARRSAAGSSS